MRTTSLLRVFALSASVSASKPRISVGELADVRVPNGDGGARIAQDTSNATLITRNDVGGFDLFSRACSAGRCKYSFASIAKPGKKC
jgi:hypothetical protein